jgi:hypothetical protein
MMIMMTEHEIERLAALPGYEFEREYQQALAQVRARYLACSNDALQEPQQRRQAYEAEKQAVEQRFATAAQLRSPSPTG